MTAGSNGDHEGTDLAAPAGAVGDSMSVAVWTIVSRVTGVLRGVAVAAVLGATYFANTYQFTNSLPNLIFYGLLAGSLFSSLLVPALVQHVDSGDKRAAARTAGSLLGVAMAGMLAVVPVMALLTPWLLRLGSLGAANTAAAHGQARDGAILVLLLLPQVPLYAVVGTATAVMNAHRRFALAAAAPALENLGTMAVLAVVTVLYDRAARSPGAQQHVPMSLLIILGAGTTGAVLLHASAQWWGARRVGVVLLPRAGWRDPQVRMVVRRALPAAGQAALAAMQLGALLVVADRIAGGVVAFQLAMNFYFLPIAVGATPVALSLVPRLSRMLAPGQAAIFRDTWVRGLAFASFLVLPAAVAYAVLAGPLASAIAFGGFGSPGSVHLLAASLTGLAPGIIGETLFLVTTYACYARKNTRYPLRGMILQTLVCGGGIAASAPLHGPALLTALGLSLSAGSVSAALYLVYHLRRGLPRGGEPALRPLVGALAASAVMAIPAWATAELVDSLANSHVGHVIGMLAAALVGAATYFAFQARLHAPQLEWVTGALPRGLRLPRLAVPGKLRLPRAQWAATLTGWLALRAGYNRHEEPATRSREAGARVALHDRVYFSLLSPGKVHTIMSRRRAGWRRVVERGVLAWRPVLARRRVDAALLTACAGMGGLAAVSLKYAVAGIIVIGISGWIMVRPAVAAYLLIFLTPLIVGVNAGAVIPLLRPNEALMVLAAGVLGLRWLAGVRTGDRRWPRLDRVDITLIVVGLTSSVVPLMMMVVRQRTITSTDILYSIVMWKLIAEYAVVRTAVTTRAQVTRCLVLSMLSAAIVSGIGILQSLSLFGVPGLLAKYYAPLGVTSALSIGRGSSLLSLPAAVADLAILNLAIAIAMIARRYPHRMLLGGLAVVFVMGVVAAAEFSTVIGMILAVAVIVVLTRWGRIIVYAVPVAIAGCAALWPVIQIRLGGFQSASGLPNSWLTRLYNLQTYFWPVLVADHNWILGVRPTARVVATDQEYGYVWIESGYTWLLWGGGIPLLLSYLAFAWTSIRKGWTYARRPDVSGVAGTAVAAVMCSQVFLMLFDPHLTYRGSGDMLFLILALVRVLPGRAPGREPGSRQGPADAAIDRSVTVPAPRREEVFA